MWKGPQALKGKFEYKIVNFIVSEARDECEEMDQRWLGVQGSDSAGSAGPCSQS